MKRADVRTREGWEHFTKELQRLLDSPHAKLSGAERETCERLISLEGQELCDALDGVSFDADRGLVILQQHVFDLVSRKEVARC